mgnify:FL=1
MRNGGGRQEQERRHICIPTVVSDPPEVGGVEAAPETGKESLPRNAGTVARKATRRASAGKIAPIWRKPDLDLVSSEQENRL